MITILHAVVYPWQPDFFYQNLSLLPASMQQKIIGYKNKNDQQLRIMGKLLLAQLITALLPLKHYSLADIQYDAFNKPFLAEGFHFSIAHTDGMVVCAACLEARVGIDIEKNNPIDILLLREYFTIKEWQWLEEKHFAASCFYFLWTRKEALLKAAGKGIYESFEKIEVLNNELVYEEEQYFLQQMVLPGENFFISIAANGQQLLDCREVFLQ